MIAPRTIRRSLGALLLSAAALALAAPVAAGAAPAVPWVSPDGPLTVTPDGAVWFASGGLARMTPDGSVTTYALPGVLQISDVAADARGDVWFGEFGGRVGRLTPAGALTTYPRGVPGTMCGECDGDDIAVAPGGGVWIAGGAMPLGRVTAEGVFWVVWSALDEPSGDIAAGPDGAMWLTLPTSGRIARVSAAGEVTTFGEGRRLAPAGIAAGPDGALWFTEPERERIGRITVDGVITSSATPGVLPEQIVAGADGRLWFTTRAGDSIGRITTSGAVDSVAVPATGGVSPAGLAAAPGGGVWFMMGGLHRIGRITASGLVQQFPPPARVTSRRPIGTGALRVRVRCPSGAAIDCRAALRLRLRPTGRPIGSSRFALVPPGGVADVVLPVPSRRRAAAARGALGVSLTPLMSPGVAFGGDRGVPVAPEDGPGDVIGLSGLTPAAREGEEIFLTAGCTSCHRVKAVGATGPGPALTREGAAGRPAAGYRRLLRNPPGKVMPAFPTFSEPQYRAIGVFLAGLGTRFR